MPVIGAAPLTSAAIIASLGYTPVNRAGDTMTGALTVAPTVAVNASTTTSDAGLSVTGGSVSGFGSIELGGTSGAYLDMKSPASDDYDVRFLMASNAFSISVATGNTFIVNVEGAANSISFSTNNVARLIASDTSITTSVPITAGGGTVTASTPVLNLTQTWNNVAVTFTGLLANVTDTTSATASLLMDLQVGGSSRFSVRKDGLMTSANAIFASSGSSFGWSSRSQMRAPVDGQITLFNAALSDFTRLNFGGATSSFPALKRSSATLQARLADDSAFTFMQAQLQTSVNATTGLTAGVLAATTNASIVVYDAAGQVYRVPCII